MNDFINGLKRCFDSYCEYVKEENRRKSMTPKEYGMMLQRKGRKKGRKRR